jgi:peptide/nickel transport system substrate-binding protein
MRFSMQLARITTITLAFAASSAVAQSLAKSPGQLAWAIKYDPKTFDPAKADEQVSATVRFLTGGVLLRINRPTQQPEPELAESLSISSDGHLVTFHLRPNLRFSDGSALTSRDVAATIRRTLNPATAAPVADEFIAPAKVTVDTPDRLTVRVHLPERVLSIAGVFDEIAIEPAQHFGDARITSGAFTLADYRPGQFVLLNRNPNYFKRDAQGRQLPYANSIRLDVLANREQEAARFERGEYDLMDSLAPEYFNLLARKSPKAVHDLGPALNTEQLWFNQSPSSPLPAYEKQWYQSQAFRAAVSQAIHRSDLARIAYAGHATPAYSFLSPANKQWYNTHLRFPQEDLAAAARLLAAAGFRKNGNQLVDSSGHAVKFSILTNAGNRARQQMAILIQQDLSALGIQVNVVTLDFPALIERLMHTQDYEACLLGLSNVDPDPNAMMNLWQSSSANHQWNPSERAPATPWEARIDQDMQTQATAVRFVDRKKAIDDVQQIVADQQPFIYLVYPNALYAVSPALSGVEPTVYQPGLIWNIAAVHPAGGTR